MQSARQASPAEPDPVTRDFYVRAMQVLDHAQVPYLVGGGYAMACLAGIVRNTKDLDVFIYRRDFERALAAMSAAGYRTEITWPHFLAKAIQDPAFMDMIYNSGNGLCPVDDEWFAHATEAEVLGYHTRLCPPEETVWSKAFVMDRDRFDGADVAHLILARGDQFDWPRLVRRFQGHERVLLAHLVLFGYIYPSDRFRVPGWVIEQLSAAANAEPPIAERICGGTFLATRSYLDDVRTWGYADARLRPRGPLTSDEVSTLPAA